jgi:hypothetical protein
MRVCATTVWFLLAALTPGLAQSKKQDAPADPHTQQTTVPGVRSSGEPTKIEPAKATDIRRLLELTGVKALATQTMDSMMEGIKPLLANSLPPGEYREKLVDLFSARFRTKADPQHLVELAIPIYDKYFSNDEIKGLIQFYETPLGQKAIRLLPTVVAEMQKEGKQWGEGLGRDSMREVLAEHPDLAQALEAAAKSTQR